jgi:hypothetical protein
MIYPDDLPLVQLIKLYRAMPTEIIISDLEYGKMNREVGLSLKRGVKVEVSVYVNPIAAEFAAIETQIAAEKEAGDLVDSNCDYLDTPAQQTADAMTRWMQ